MRNPVLKIQHPAWTVALCMLAWASLRIIPGEIDPIYQSVIGSIAKPGMPIDSNYGTQTWYLGIQGTSWAGIAQPGDSADAFSRAIAANPSAVVEVRRTASELARGFYHPFRRVKTISIHATITNGTPLPPDRLRSLIEALNQSGASNSFGAWPEIEPDLFQYVQGSATYTVTTIEWLALAHNTIATLVWLALPISLGWIPRTLRSRRGDRRQRAGLCPSCAYDRRSTPLEAPCPECGRAGAATPSA